MGGVVHVDTSFDDIEFPARKCATLAQSAQRRVGIHHVDPRRMRALWRAYERAITREGNGTTGRDPARPSRCSINSHGDPIETHDFSEHRYLDTFRRPRQAARCRSIVHTKKLQARHPHCVPHMAYVKHHPETSPCWGGLGRYKCAGFQLDENDNCNLQYYIYCEQLYKIGEKKSWCPAPKGYPAHCCYSRALDESAGRKRRLGPRQFLLEVFPNQPAFANDKQSTRVRSHENRSKAARQGAEV